MRAFIAIEIPPEIKQAAFEIQKTLNRNLPKVSWTENNNLHITVKFLGEISEETAEKIKQLTLETAGKTSVFKVKFETIGIFPNLEQAGVIWLGSKNIPQELKLMAGQLELNLERLGIPKENRMFSSHMTIGRIKSHINSGDIQEALDNIAGKLSNRNLEFSALGLTLFKSSLQAQGPSYTPLILAKFRIA